MNLFCRDQLKLCCSSPPTVVPLPEHCTLFEATHIFSGSILEFSLQGEKKRLQLHVLKMCDMQIINPTICQQMSALNSGIIHFFDFLIIANNWLMGKSRCHEDKLVLWSGTRRISTTKVSCGSSRTILVLLCVPVQHQYQHLIHSGSQYFIVSQP